MSKENKPPTNVFCEACTGPNDCNWEGYDSELLPLPEYMDETDYAGICPICGSDASFGPSSDSEIQEN